MGTSLSSGQFATKVLAHGVFGGTMTLALGVKFIRLILETHPFGAGVKKHSRCFFGHGFAAAGATQLSSSLIDLIPGPKAGRVFVAAIVGGTVSETVGGKFVNGAVTAALSRLLNDEKHNHMKTAQDDLSNLSFFDQVKLADYVSIEHVDNVVDQAIQDSSFFDWLTGGAGLNVDDFQRYIFLRDHGWVDLRHVVSAAYNPFSTIGIGDVPGLGIELGQTINEPYSAFLREDLRSNAIGAQATWNHINGLNRPGTTVGQSVQRILWRLNPVSKQSAAKILNNQSNQP